MGSPVASAIKPASDPPSTLSITPYNASNSHPDFSQDWLEETHLGPLSPALIYAIRANDPSAVRDLDRDGYREVNKSVLENVVGKERQKPLPLAPYFGDRNPIVHLNDTIPGLPFFLAEATRHHNWRLARLFFHRYAEGSENPLRKVAKLLALHLSQTAMHAGVDVDEVSLENGSGFSVHGSGRLRFDCVQFALLAHSDLAGIPGLTFHFVSLQSRSETAEDAPVAAAEVYQLDYYGFETPNGLGDPKGRTGHHVILFMEDRKGNYLIADNQTVRYVLSSASFVQLLRRFYNRRYDTYSDFPRYLDWQEGAKARKSWKPL